VTSSASRTAGFLLLCVAFAAAGVLCAQARSALRAPYFLSGWCTLAIFAAFVARSWGRPAVDFELARRVRAHLWTACVLTGAFVLHIDLRVPDGTLELLVSALVVAVVVSAVAGAGIVGDVADDPRLERWLVRHTALTHGLLALAIVHGAVVHLHGWLSPLVAGR
jgi:hypothetical protein